ncbi:YciI family protein [Enterococcus larvae]|uniref:YciI family protein n=1 Tax=Enterococcus larvae TaxID=2794352 RepID=UPI003F38AFF6
MKKYIGSLKEKRSALMTDELLIAHVRHLQYLEQAGTLLLCGPLKDSDQAFQLLQAESLLEAQLLFFSDPFIQNGYYNHCTVHELVEANPANYFLISDSKLLNRLGQDK